MHVQPMFVRERRAAELLDMSLERFRALVADGILPGPRRIGDCERWDVEELQRAARGEPATLDDVQWGA